jgi:glycosyltransferase involved in cell wall biosynthesis
MSWLIAIFLFLLGFIDSDRKNNNSKKFESNKQSFNENTTQHSNKSINSHQPSVSIVIPAFNEEENVANVVSVVTVIPYVSEVIVVDDGSYDKTSEEARLAGATVISHASNQGKGAALKTGFRHSKGDIIAFIDGDIQNLTAEKVDNIITPILENKTEITKTKFIRDSGRVTELTAKPLLRFFFPEITFDQPLSGQFAGKRHILNKIKFEKDYGVDVGIVLDAEAYGINIKEVDIGEIKHESSPLTDLYTMANEVVRTIVDRANKYGRITLMDTIGNCIRSVILGLSLIILGLFTIFFVQWIPLEIGIILSIVGFAIFLYYGVLLIKKTVYVYKNRAKGNIFKSFIKMHFPVLISAIVLILMLSTFLSAANFSSGQISIEPNSRNLIIFSGPDNTISVRGPYTIDSALENEVNIIRIPEDVLKTLELGYNDKIIINDIYYTLNRTREGESHILRLPQDVRTFFNVQVGDVVSDSKIRSVFDGAYVESNINSTNLTNDSFLNEYFILNSKSSEGKIIDIYMDNKFISSEHVLFKENSSYNLKINGVIAKTFFINDTSTTDTIFTYWGDHIIEIRFTGNNMSSIKSFVSNDFGSFLSFVI